MPVVTLWYEVIGGHYKRILEPLNSSPFERLLKNTNLRCRYNRVLVNFLVKKSNNGFETD